MKYGWTLILVLTTGTLFAACGEEESSTASFTFKYSNSQSETHPRTASMRHFEETLEAATEGRIQVEIFPDGVLGSEAEVLELVKTGVALQGARGGLFASANPKFLLYTLPFLFETTDQALAVMRGPFGQSVNAGALANGFYVPATGVAGGFRNITNNVHPIAQASDLVGLKMRTPPLEVTISTFEAFGAEPVAISYNDLYLALQDGEADGQENPFSNIADKKFYEVQDYLSIVNWQIHPDPLYVNPDWYNSLPADLKDAFDAAVVESMEYSDEIWLASEAGYLEQIESEFAGGVNELTPEARVGFVDLVSDVWSEYANAGFYTQADLDLVLGAIQ